ncbi:MAG: biotin--[acetyl-CoA-carboxylase] ligase [Pirellulaceae bacterium]|nr:biotin--[acetyl-CoA-carboxylase] ligase [Pirellulaceae bacterium]
MNELFELRRTAVIDQIVSEGLITHVDWFQEIDSTNAYLKRFLNQNPVSGLPRLVLADRQTAGRGRGKNAWWSPDGCLMFSLAWRPSKTDIHENIEWQSRLVQLPLVVGIAVAKALSGFLKDGNSVKVKWPNDVYIHQKKVCGILIESIVGVDEPFWIVGAGVNVLVPIADAPEPIRSNATSLHLECARSFRETLCVESILLAIVQSLQATFDDWQSNNDFLHQVWSQHCFLTDRLVDIQTSGRNLQGTCIGIDDSGALVLRDQKGLLHCVLSGVVQSWQ